MRKRKQTRSAERKYADQQLTGINEEVKDTHRHRVAEFFLRYPPPRGITPTCFCLPGIGWAFERMFDERLGDPELRFIGVERNFEVLETGLLSMPGTKLQPYVEPLFAGVDPVRCYRTDRARLLHCDASLFMNLGTDTRETHPLQKYWDRTYKGWTCAWLDLCGPISDELVTCCRRLEHYLSSQSWTVPVAITFMVGREEPHHYRKFQVPGYQKCPMDARIPYLKTFWSGNTLRRVEFVESWLYYSKSGARMGVMTALFHKKS